MLYTFITRLGAIFELISLSIILMVNQNVFDAGFIIFLSFYFVIDLFYIHFYVMQYSL